MKISWNIVDSSILLVIIVPERGDAATRAHIGEIEGEVWVEAEVEDVQETEGDDGDPDRETEVGDHECVEVGLQADVLGMLDQQAPQKQVADNNIHWKYSANGMASKLYRAYIDLYIYYID